MENYCLLETRNGQGISKSLDRDLQLWFVATGRNDHFLTVTVLLANSFAGNNLLILEIST